MADHEPKQSYDDRIRAAEEFFGLDPSECAEYHAVMDRLQAELLRQRVENLG
jgi:hypothetical protein